MKLTKEAAEKYLQDNGWKPSKYANHWLCKGMNPKLGGLDLDYAVERQHQFDIIAKYGAFYCAVRDAYGYGYFVSKYTSKTERPVKTEYTHLSKEDATEIAGRLL